MMIYKSISDLSTDIHSNISRIPNDIDLIVGVPRSGLLVANMIALIRNIPLTDVDGLLSGRVFACGRTKEIRERVNSKNLKKVLVVDDSVASGISMGQVKEKIINAGITTDIVYFAAYVTPEHKDDVDMYLDVLEMPRIFEWNIFHHVEILQKSCVDLDGILCEDPTDIQNDDGNNYIEFISSAKPKIIPSCEVGCIVTSRLEKYRAATEKWLVENNVHYKRLIMLDSTAEERKEMDLHKIHKANFYKNSDYILFIESEARQAEYVYQSSQKPVFCLENNIFYDGGLNYKLLYEMPKQTSQKIKTYIKKRLPLIYRFYKTYFLK